LEEQVVWDYPNGERIGSFVSRSPASRKASDGHDSWSEAAEDKESEVADYEIQDEEDLDDDSEFDDFLEEEDD